MLAFPTDRTTIGSWLQLADPSLAEIMARGGFDWLTIDLEHSATSITDAARLIRIGDLAGVPMLVRLSGHDTEQAKRVLDAGASGIIVPMVNTPEEAERMVAAAHYPPRGTRGVGLARAQGYGVDFDAYRDGRAGEICVIAQIEHIDGVRNLDAILDVDGIDGFFVGPYDLSGSLGRPGDFENPGVRSALDEVGAHITADGPFAGIHVVEPDLDKLAQAVSAGYRFIAFASDMLVFSHRIRELGPALDGMR